LDADRPYLALLDAVMEAQAALVARWVQVGFIHGVMNTDNMASRARPSTTAPAPSWMPMTRNGVQLHRRVRPLCLCQPAAHRAVEPRTLAETLLTLIDPDRDEAVKIATERIEGFPAIYARHWISGFRKKIGLVSEEDGDLDLIQACSTPCSWRAPTSPTPSASCRMAKSPLLSGLDAEMARAHCARSSVYGGAPQR
jgi:serine/tyrosine/threonine adenylyltransferase